MHSRAERAIMWLPWFNGDAYHQSYMIMRNFVMQDAACFVRPNLRRNGFDIKLRNRLGINYFIEGEFYARPGQVPDDNGDIIVADYRQDQPNNVEMPENGMPIVFIEEPIVPDNNNEFNENPEQPMEAQEFIIIDVGPAEQEDLPQNEQIVHNDSGIDDDEE